MDSTSTPTKKKTPRKPSSTAKKKKKTASTPRKFADAVTKKPTRDEQNDGADNDEFMNDTIFEQQQQPNSNNTPTTTTVLSQIRELQNQVQQSRLLLLEKDNLADEDDEVDMDYTPVQSRRKKQKTGAPPPFVKRNLARIFIMDVNKQQHDGYLAATSEKSVHFPARRFCSICGYVSNYTCVKCGQRYCCVACYTTHEDTRCLKHK